MSRMLDGASLFSSVSSGLNNTYSVLSSTFKDGITLANLSSANATTALNSNSLSSNFKSYLATNFKTLDKNADGTISTDELNNLTNSIANTGLTREQLYQLGTTSGMSSSLLETVSNYFDEIDTNKDGKVTNAEIKEFGAKSSMEKQKEEDLEKKLTNMSTYYETSNSNTGSLLDYKYLQDKEEAST